jgi:hypothetical protein
MYNMIFGTSKAAPLLLAVLGLKREDTGRFRDCFLTEQGEIAVYTRNGGGNRHCSHVDDPRWGDSGCHGEAYEVETDEEVWLTKEDIANGVAGSARLLNVFSGDKRMARTGKMIKQTRYTCGGPESEKCACTGCTITYRLPKHPLYLRDEDDEFDYTYATVYFKMPENIDRELVKSIEPELARDGVWQDFIAALQASTKS